jgi:ATP/maltotriose-dependent transcriptional regulator MalT
MYRSSIIHTLTSQTENTKAGVAFFYCDGNSPEKQSLRTILGSLVRSLIPASGFSDLDKLKELKDKYKGSSVVSVDNLKSIFKDVASSINEVYLVVDGLDECENREELLTTLSSLPSCQSSSINLLVTSRPETDIDKAFSGKPRLQIDQLVRADISSYVSWRLTHEEKLKRIKGGLKEEIQEKLVTKGAGM